MPWGRLSLWKWVPGISPGVKAASAFGWWPTTIVVPKVEKIRGFNLPGTPRATSACRGIPLLLLLPLSNTYINRCVWLHFIDICDPINTTGTSHMKATSSISLSAFRNSATTAEAIQPQNERTEHREKDTDGGNLKNHSASTTPASWRPCKFDAYRQSRCSRYESNDAPSYSLHVFLIQGIFSTQSIRLSPHKQMHFGNHRLISLITSLKFTDPDKHRSSLPVFSWYQNTTTATIHMLTHSLPAI